MKRLPLVSIGNHSFDRGLAPGTSQDGADRDTGFIDGKYALQWNGNWAALLPP